MLQPRTMLVFGATGGTGRHFLPMALEAEHTVRVLVRSRAKLPMEHPRLEVQQGSITDVADADLDGLVRGADAVISMLGDREMQRDARINTEFVRRLVPAMRRHGVKRLWYQAGGLSRPYEGHLSPMLWMIRHTIARGFEGQHRDNEGVMAYLAKDAPDVEWIVHRAGIVGDGLTKGTLLRSRTKFSIGTFRDCAAYTFRTIVDPTAIRTSDFSRYAEG